MKDKEQNLAVLIRFGELWLRGGNRHSYIKMLKSNIALQLNLKEDLIIEEYDKLLIHIKKGDKTERILEGLSRVFGISNFEVSAIANPDLSSIEKTAIWLLKKADKKRGKKLRIEAHRANKQLPFDSAEIKKSIAKAAVRLGYELELDNPDITIYVTAYDSKAFVYTDRRDGLGGLPVGSSGNAMVLLSGGIDSPVAAWYAMKRGARPIFLHVHAFQTNADAKSSKLADIINALSKYTPSYKIYYVPSHIFQMSVAGLRSSYESVMFKAFILRLAEMIAKEEDAKAIFTGESLGQVSSQTMPNLAASEQSVNLPILRPLIGFDKKEIIEVAKKIGTYDLSIIPYRDVCLINSKMVTTNANTEKVGRMLKEISMDETVSRSYKAAEVASPY